MVECEDRVVGKMYAKVAFQFMTKLVEVSASFLDQCLVVTDSRTLARRPRKGQLVARC